MSRRYIKRNKDFDVKIGTNVKIEHVGLSENNLTWEYVIGYLDKIDAEYNVVEIKSNKPDDEAIKEIHLETLALDDINYLAMSKLYKMWDDFNLVGDPYDIDLIIFYII